MFTTVKGTQDFLTMQPFNLLIEQARKHLHIFHFQEIGLPLLEHTELFVRSLGTHTDVVSKEMFLVQTHDEDSICLRPEATASTARAFIEHNINTLPWKVFTWGPMFRYERPQKGRSRQFHQINIEVIGTAAIAYDAYFIYMLDQFFCQRLQLNSYALCINFLGCPPDRQHYKEILGQFLTKHYAALCETCRKRKDANILRIFDCKNKQCHELYKQAPLLTDYLCTPCADEWQTLKHTLDLLAISYTHVPTLVRGLDYYNKTVFEFVSTNLGAQNAFCGGGRYDHLIAELGGSPDQPSIGAAIGIERVLLLLEQKSSQPVAAPSPLHVIIPLTVEQRSLALLIAQTLTHHQLPTEILLEDQSMKSMMRKANKLGATQCLIIGPDEQKNNQVNVKDMLTGESALIAHDQLVAHLQRLSP